MVCDMSKKQQTMNIIRNIRNENSHIEIIIIIDRDHVDYNDYMSLQVQDEVYIAVYNDYYEGGFGTHINEFSSGDHGNEIYVFNLLCPSYVDGHEMYVEIQHLKTSVRSF